MLTVETIGRIRREHFLKGKTIKEVARDLKVSCNTVRKVLRSGETLFEYERTIQPRHPFRASRRCRTRLVLA
jgi:transposase